MLKGGESFSKTMECKQQHSFYPNEEPKKDNDGEDIWKALIW